MQALRYARATSVEDAIRLLQEGGPNARVLAGGTDVIVQARERRRTVDLFIDIKRIPEVMLMTYDEQWGLTVGAGMPLYLIYGDYLVQQHFPALAEATHVIGGKAVQGRATLGGNVMNASPAADSVPALLALDTAAIVAGPNGRRGVPLEELITGPGQTSLAPGEFVVSFRIPPGGRKSGQAWERFIPRNEMDIAVVNAAAFVRFEGPTIVEARVALGAVAPTAILVPEAAAILEGQRPSESVIERAAAAAEAAARPIDDMRGSVRQRKHLANVLARRVITEAIARAEQSEEQ